MTDEVFWAIGRSTGAMATLLLTLSMVLGIVTRSGRPIPGLPRFAVQNIHRSISLFSLIFTAVHVITLLCDKYAKLNVIDIFVPFTSATSPLWNGIGASATDLLLALAITGLARSRINDKLFHLIHLGAYACWPLAIAHGFGEGSDRSATWFLLLNALCILLVGCAVAYRVLLPKRDAAIVISATARGRA